MKTIWKFIISSFVLLLIVFSFFLGMYVKGYSMVHRPKRVTMNDYGLNMDSLKWCILTKGDINAYNEFCIQSMDSKYDKDAVLIYALIMSNKYKFAQANVDVYLSIINRYEHVDSAGIIDTETLNLALYYLNKGAKMKEYNALNKLSSLYLEGKYVSKDTIKAIKLAQEAKKLR